MIFECSLDATPHRGSSRWTRIRHFRQQHRPNGSQLLQSHRTCHRVFSIRCFGRQRSPRWLSRLGSPTRCPIHRTPRHIHVTQNYECVIDRMYVSLKMYIECRIVYGLFRSTGFEKRKRFLHTLIFGTPWEENRDIPNTSEGQYIETGKL